jgi:hypothetical protein
VASKVVTDVLSVAVVDVPVLVVDSDVVKVLVVAEDVAEVVVAIVVVKVVEGVTEVDAVVVVLAEVVADVEVVGDVVAVTGHDAARPGQHDPNIVHPAPHEHTPLSPPGIVNTIAALELHLALHRSITAVVGVEVAVVSGQNV